MIGFSSSCMQSIPFDGGAMLRVDYSLPFAYKFASFIGHLCNILIISLLIYSVFKIFNYLHKNHQRKMNILEDIQERVYTIEKLLINNGETEFENTETINVDKNEEDMNSNEGVFIVDENGTVTTKETGSLVREEENASELENNKENEE